MRKTILIIALLLSSVTGMNSAIAHGGGLDWQGGHNCRVGSCAGTYHCHQARAGFCAPASTPVSPKVVKVGVSCIEPDTSNLTKNHIAMIQSRLISLKYLSGSRDGSLGSQTMKSLNKFEKDNGLTKSNSESIYFDSLSKLGAMCA